MKSFRKIVSEVAQPKAGDEKHFKDKHIVTKVDYPVDVEDQFTGGKTVKKAPKRKADLEAGEDESVYEAMDPVNAKELKGTHAQRKDKDIDNDGDVDSSDKYLHTRRKAISKAMKKEEAELDEARKSDSYQFTHKPGDEESEKKLADLKKSIKGTGKRVVLQGRLGKDNPNAHKYSKNAPRAKYVDGKRVNSDVSGKAGAHSHQRIQKADAAHHDVYVYDRNESVELDEISKKTLGSYIKKAKTDVAGKAYQLGARDPLKPKASWSKTLGREKHIDKAVDRLTKEEVEQLDELSPNTLHSYIKKAAGNMAGNAAVAAAQASSSMKKSSPDVKRKIKNRMQGITGASGRLADKANADMYENWQEEIPMMMRQLEFIAYAAEEIMDYVEMAGDPEEWFQNKISGIHQSMLSMYAYAQGGRRAGYGFDESVELDEASDPRKVRDELKSQGKHKEAGEHAFKHDLGRSYGPHFGMRSSKNSAEMEYHKGYDYAKARAGKADRLKNEEVELDEVSDKKLDAYRQKAFADQPAGDDGSDKYRKRKFGRDLAFAKQTGRAKVLATKEEVELDEVSTEKLRDYASAALQDKNKAKADKRWKYAGKAMQKVADREVKAAHDRKYNKMESVELDEAKTDIYHKHMLKALGKSRLPKGHQYTSAIATNGDFVVHDGGGRVAGRIPKGEHNLNEVSDKKLDAYRQKAFADQPAGDDGSDKYRKRKFGRDLAFAKQTGRAKVLATKEEVELDEAAPKIKTDFLKTQREKDRAHDAAMGRTPTGRKKVMTSTQKSMASMRKEEAELDEATPTKKAITRALQGMKVQPKEKVTVKKAPWEKNEEVDLDESITKMSHGRLKFHMNSGVPHGSYTKDEMKAERDRRLKTDPIGYRSAKAGLSEVTQTAMKKTVTYIDPKGHSRTRNVPVKKIDKDDHGQDKIRESVEMLDEAFKVGIVKLKDGGSVVLKKEDADLLNKMFKDLSSTNRKKMQEVAMKDKNGFDEILGFAREAL